MPCAARRSEPAQMTSSALRERSARPCSPSAQRRASARLLLPEPFGPTTALIPAPNSTTVRSANDLNPCRRSASSRAGGRAVERVEGHERVVRAGRSATAVPTPVTAVVPEPIERLRGRRGLGDASRRPLADAEHLALDPDLDAERPSRGPARSRRDPVVGPRAGSPLGVLLEAALGALEGAPGGPSDASSGVASDVSQSRTGAQPRSR